MKRFHFNQVVLGLATFFGVVALRHYFFESDFQSGTRALTAAIIALVLVAGVVLQHVAERKATRK